MNSTPVITSAPLFGESATERVVVSRRFKWLFLSLALILVAAVTAVLSFYAYIAWVLSRPVIPPLQSNPLLAVGLAYEEVEFPSANGGTMVDGWYIPGSTAATVVLSHGYGTNREEPWVPSYELATEINRHQYNVLMFDYGFVHPDRPFTGGIIETQELLGAIEYVKERGAEQVYVWGFSMGAGTALQAALKTDLIDGMILDSTFILEPDTMFYNLKQQVSLLPRFPSIALVNMFLPVFNGYSLGQIPYRTVNATSYTVPIFLIHGELDDKAPYSTITRFYANQKDQPLTELWLLPDSIHEMIFRTHPEEYLQRTFQFLDGIGQRSGQTV
ncbi:alpha/beta hydrolase [Paenibacillus sp. J2TS4]|uniref:alpha/beta hydrolase n=1 Tax=Paenibacillus sp. J2TS4 TaxID=2807194 RepID=UPI001B009408|nr:alpha/beta fold hydrolase [Paenibacillus sp. J2TS4]GIP35749.1 hypothetical protein J2TS4_49590 [Paenibacillus sp. J2TS4]